MVTTHNLRSEALTIIRELNHLLESQETILASSEDCDYFRNVYRSLKKSPEINHKVNVCPLPAAPISSPSPQPPIIEQPIKAALLPINAEVSLPTPCHAGEDVVKVTECDILPAPVEPSHRLSPAPERSFDDIRKILAQVAPDLILLADPPNDLGARRVAERWKTQNQSALISLISLNESGPQRQFLMNLSQAIDVVFGEARLICAEGIEKDNQWEAFLSVPKLKLIIIGDYALWQMPNLLQFYRENPNRMERFLLNKPVMLLPDLTLYQKDPLLKRSLWKAICQKISS